MISTSDGEIHAVSFPVGHLPYNQSALENNVSISTAKFDIVQFCVARIKRN